MRWCAERERIQVKGAVSEGIKLIIDKSSLCKQKRAINKGGTWRDFSV